MSIGLAKWAQFFEAVRQLGKQTIVYNHAMHFAPRGRLFERLRTPEGKLSLPVYENTFRNHPAIGIFVGSPVDDGNSRKRISESLNPLPVSFLCAHADTRRFSPIASVAIFSASERA